ncbi:cytosolic protein, partial [Bacillus thuringiensis]
PIGYFTNTFKQMVYNYVDEFRDLHNLAQRKTNVHVRNLAIFERIIEG